ncbi:MULTISPECIES: hypothetical protein [unclassified Streptomyces]|uniref:hypothetical protein n=1 Tax=unclassified Streptomyces TaxID=2593676 RepID=UPI0036E0E36A
MNTHAHLLAQRLDVSHLLHRKEAMNSTAGALSLLVLMVLIGVFIATLVAVLTGLLARLDGESVARAVRSAGAAFATCLTIIVAFLSFATIILL